MASNRFTSYSADQVAAIVANRRIQGGYDDGEFISIEAAAEAWLPKVGADGESAVARSNNRSATVKIKLLHTSEGNLVLAQLYNQALLAPNNVFLPFMLVDLSAESTIVCQAEHIVVQKMATISRAREVVANEWTCWVPVMNFTPSGNLVL